MLGQVKAMLGKKAPAPVVALLCMTFGLAGVWCCGSAHLPSVTDGQPSTAAMEVEGCIESVQLAADNAAETGDRIAAVTTAFMHCGSLARRGVHTMCQIGLLPATCELCKADELASVSVPGATVLLESVPAPPPGAVQGGPAETESTVAAQ